MHFVLRTVLALFFTAMVTASCKQRAADEASTPSAKIVSERKGTEPYKAHDIVLDFVGGVNYDIGAGPVGSNSKSVTAAQISLLDNNGVVLAKAPVIASSVEFIKLGGGLSFDGRVAIDLFHGKKLGDLLGSYYGGGIGLNLLITGAGADVGINRNGVVMRNTSYKAVGLMAQFGPQIVTIQAVEPNDLFWQTPVEAASTIYFRPESVNRRAWILDHSVPRDSYRAFVSLNWDPEARNFFAEVLVVDNKMKPVAQKTRLEYVKETDQFVYTLGSLLKMQLAFLGSEEKESCFVRWNGDENVSVISKCTGWQDFVHSVRGPQGTFRKDGI